MYNFPGYDDEPRTAESALQEWIDTQELLFESEEQEELFWQFTDRSASPEFNIQAIQAGADYVGIDLVTLGYPLPALIES